MIPNRQGTNCNRICGNGRLSEQCLLHKETETTAMTSDHSQFRPDLTRMKIRQRNATLSNKLERARLLHLRCCCAKQCLDNQLHGPLGLAYLLSHRCIHCGGCDALGLANISGKRGCTKPVMKSPKWQQQRECCSRGGDQDALATAHFHVCPGAVLHGDCK